MPLLAWPVIVATVPATLEAFMNKLVGHGYLKGGDVGKMLTAPSAILHGHA